MLTDPKLRSQVDALWDKFWTGGLSNPLDAIEQFSYLLFLKRLDDRENAAERQAKRKGTMYQAKVPKEMRWGYWTQMKAEEALNHLKLVVFPKLVELGEGQSSFAEYMKGAQCKINKAGLLIEACNLIDQMKIAEQNQDVQGDLYEYMLGHMQFAGRGGQFRTPRHIIRMMVEMTVPKVALGRPFRRFDSGDNIYQRDPSERFSRGNNVPKGLFWRWDFFCSSLRDESHNHPRPSRRFDSGDKIYQHEPSGRLTLC